MQWSADALARARDDGRLVINPVVYAEVSTGFDRIEDLDDAMPADDFEREPLPYEAGFLVGKAFLAYRKRGGQRRSLLLYRRARCGAQVPAADTGRNAIPHLLPFRRSDRSLTGAALLQPRRNRGGPRYLRSGHCGMPGDRFRDRYAAARRALNRRDRRSMPGGEDGRTAECGNVWVPQDWAHPDGPAMPLRVVVVLQRAAAWLRGAAIHARADKDQRAVHQRERRAAQGRDRPGVADVGVGAPGLAGRAPTPGRPGDMMVRCAPGNDGCLMTSALSCWPSCSFGTLSWPPR